MDPATDVDDGRQSGIYAAVLELLGETGYDRLTLDAVAARARASKATLYRHWDGKAELVVAALAHRHRDQFPLPDTGSLRGDLVAGLTALRAQLRGKDLAVVCGLLTAMHSDPRLAALLRAQVVDDHCAGARSWVQRAIDRGVLPEQTDTEILGEVVIPMVLCRLLITGEPVDEPFINRTVDDVVLPLLHHASGRKVLA